MNLTEIASAFLLQFPGGAIEEVHRQERMLERFGQVAFGGFGLVVLTGIVAIIYLIITKMILSGVNFWSGLLLVAFIVFASLALAYVFLNEAIKEKKEKLNVRDHEPVLPPRIETPSLGHDTFEPAVSVVEDTTDLLPVKNKTRNLS